MEAVIDEILSYEPDKAEYGEPSRRLSSLKYRSYRALGKFKPVTKAQVEEIEDRLEMR